MGIVGVEDWNDRIRFQSFIGTVRKGLFGYMSFTPVYTDGTPYCIYTPYRIVFT